MILDNAVIACSFSNEQEGVEGVGVRGRLLASTQRVKPSLIRFRTIPQLNLHPLSPSSNCVFSG
jgi:hypothetical protein